MSICMRRFGLVALLGAAFLGLTSNVSAQFNFNPNMNPSVVSGLNQAQYMAYLQQAAAARAVASQNLFPATALSSVNPYTPVTTNPYAPVTSTPWGAGSAFPMSPYDQSFINPYLPYSGAGSVLQGTADVMRAYGTVITSQEQARTMRQQALQARLDTRKKSFDLEMYIKANTPTFTEEQAKVVRMTLKRIQGYSTDPEINNGKSLNFLLDDMAKHPAKKVVIEPFALSQDILGHLNITKGTFSLGVLRNNGEFIWPVAFQEYFPADQLRLIESQTKTLVKNADRGKFPDVNVLKDLRNEVDKIREQLFMKVNEIPTTQYLEAKRFLNSLDNARLALEQGEAQTQINFQKWAGGGKNLQELVDYMVANGLRFTTSTQGDEFAYRAVYSGMAALNVALNSMVGVGSPAPSESPEP